MPSFHNQGGAGEGEHPMVVEAEPVGTVQVERAAKVVQVELEEVATFMSTILGPLPTMDEYRLLKISSEVWK